MSRLVIAVGTAQFVLTADELDKHPDSLLSSLMNDTITKSGFEAPQGEAPEPVEPQEAAASNGIFWTFRVWLWSVFTCHWTKCWSSVEAELDHPAGQQQSLLTEWLSAVEGGWRVDLDAMNIPIKSKLQVLDIASVAELLHAAYRQDFISEDILEPLLRGRPPAATAQRPGISIEKEYEYHSSLQADVSKILDYFNLPGPVTRWLPPPQSLNVGRGRLLRFIHTCDIIHQVEAVVDAMLAYKPQQEQTEPTHEVIFVVSINDKEVHYRPNLRVYVLQHVPTPTLNVLGRMGDTIAVPLAADGSRAGDHITWQQLKAVVNDCGAVRSMEVEGFALRSAIQARVKGTGIDLFIRWISDVHLWVLAW